jgi:hypothetical protein
VLESLKPAGALPADSELRRTVRALQILAEIGTAEARNVIERMAAGAPEAPQTTEAREILERLGRSGR